MLLRQFGESLWLDVVAAWRGLWRSPLSAMLAVLTLSVGLGANTAIFAIAESIYLRPVPYTEGLYTFLSVFRNAPREAVPAADFAAWRDSLKTVQLAASRPISVSINTAGGPDYLSGAIVSPEFFQLFDVNPSLGRRFTAGEYSSDGQVVILSHGVWVRRFASNPSVIGSAVTLQGQTATIVGVMPESFQLPTDAELWQPLTARTMRAGFLRVVGKIRPDYSLESARAEIAVVGAQEANAASSANRRGVDFVPWQDARTQKARRVLLPLWGAMVCLLIAACLNTGMILLSVLRRNVTDMAVRVALGAKEGRLLRQVAFQGLLIGGAAAAAAIALSHAIISSIVSASVIGLTSATVSEHVSWERIAFCLVLALVTGGIASAGAVVRLRLASISEVLRAGSTALAGDANGGRVLKMLTAAQVAVSVVMVALAWLLSASISNLKATPLGFDSQRLMTFSLSLPESRYPADENVAAFYSELIRRLRGIRGVDAVTAVNASTSSGVPRSWCLFHPRHPVVKQWPRPTRTSGSLTPISIAF